MAVADVTQTRLAEAPAPAHLLSPLFPIHSWHMGVRSGIKRGKEKRHSHKGANHHDSLTPVIAKWNCTFCLTLCHVV